MSEQNTTLPTYKDMVESGMHVGRKRSAFNSRMKSAVYMTKDKIDIIDLVKTSQALLGAIKAMREVIDSGGKILFVGLSAQSAVITKTIAEDLQMPYVVDRWLGGTFTNFKTIISRVDYLKKLEEEKKSEAFSKFTKLERLMKEREIEKLKIKFDGIREMTKLPEMIFVSSAREAVIPVDEARKAGVISVGLVNTDSDPGRLTYAVPANDNAKQSVALVLQTIHKALKSK
ncbi:MAG: 30S ribosomal protein S2 [Candidatus Yanofskybacteria bacterium CG10_big_fil_rev_8_21_14_0_10_46_23]|uniref:Small ribosomal subunit protein uS2 n=1 Tax=Candidatus Yanofskybacteria bacterium CG10_big_fil_rev_8_21_14_0_10_46_23 TaxID=1975098 RepID=A0A2H0R462_9BACT|nr:MAG: 30S ribosomal protein S2 [Candidatus Yanofskybacteria bacterium CG10_big_fil_rev_8_21_14_0_10_46_23]